MREDYTSEEIDRLESELESKIKESEPKSHFSLDIPQVEEGFMRVDVYFPRGYETSKFNQSTVAAAIYDHYGFDIEWEEFYSVEPMYSISVWDLENTDSKNDPLEKISG